MTLDGLPEFLENPDPSLLLTDNYIVVDFETTNLDKGSPLNPMNDLVLAEWYTPERGYVYKFGGEFDMHELIKACESADIIVAHNSKFELQWLDRCGLDLRKVLPYCTLLGECVLYGNKLQTKGGISKQSLDKTATDRDWET